MKKQCIVGCWHYTLKENTKDLVRNSSSPIYLIIWLLIAKEAILKGNDDSLHNLQIQRATWKQWSYLQSLCDKVGIQNKQVNKVYTLPDNTSKSISFSSKC